MRLLVYVSLLPLRTLFKYFLFHLPVLILKNKNTMRKLFYLILIHFTFIGSVKAQNFVWAEQYGGEGEDVVRSMVTDEEGNIYMTGYFTDIAFFGSGKNETEMVSNGWFDIFVTKTSPQGDLIWVKSFGGAGFDYGTGISFDADGNIYVTGVFEESVNFNPDGENILTSLGMQDIFVIKLDVEGNHMWAKSAGGEGYEETTALGTDNQGNVYITGYFYETVDFNPAGESFELTPEGSFSSDGFIVKYDEDGSFVWARQFGGDEYELPMSMRVMENGAMYLTGKFEGTADFDPNPAESFFLSTVEGNRGVFFMYVNESGYLQSAVKVAEAPFEAIGMDAVVDDEGNAYVVGNFGGIISFAPTAGGGSPYNYTSNDSYNGFVVKINQEGLVVWAKHLAPTGEEAASLGYGIAVNSNHEAFITGFISGSIAFDDILIHQQGEHYMAAYVAKISSTGDFVYAGQFGGADFIDDHFIGVDSDDNIYLSGTLEGTVYLNPNTGNGDEAESRGFRDIYLIKMDNETMNIHDFELLTEIMIYPNPSNGIFHIQSKEKLSGKDFKVYDLNGKLMTAGKISPSHELTLNALPRGIYVLKIDDRYSSKIIRK